MPPVAKFTKKQITEAALDMIREKGMDSLTARALGNALGSSSCPIFTVFKNMDEVQQSVLEAAKALYKEYVEKGLAEVPAFKGVGKQYILFAEDEPCLFRLLFMRTGTQMKNVSRADGCPAQRAGEEKTSPARLSEQDAAPNLEEALPLIEDSYEKILMSIVTGYGISRSKAERLYRHLWIYTHGIATLCVTKMCHFTGQEISSMMTEVCSSLLKKMKEEQCDD